MLCVGTGMSSLAPLYMLQYITFFSFVNGVDGGYVQAGTLVLAPA